MTCYWEVKVEAFTGVRLEIGVATRRSIYRGGYDKNEARYLLLFCSVPFAGILVYWHSGILVHWYIGILHHPTERSCLTPLKPYPRFWEQTS